VAAEQISAEEIGGGEGIAVDPVPHQELALEVGGPDLVGRGGVVGNGARMLPTMSPAPRLHPAVAFEDVEDGAPGRPGSSRVSGLEPLQDLARTPSKAAVLVENQLDDFMGSLVRTRPWRPGVV